MPSYAYQVRNELARIFDEDPQCMRAELAALLKVGAVFVEGRMDFVNSNAAVARKVITLVKKLYPEARTEVAAIRRKKLRKSMRYVVRIFLTGHTEEFFREINSPEKIRQPEMEVSYLRGAFLANGTVNRPEAQYYLEVASIFEDVAEFVKRTFADLDFHPSIHKRNDEFVVYITEGDAVYDFLGMVGAEEAVVRFEVARNLKEVHAQVNRLVNCETANINKAIDAAQRQLADIRLLKSHEVKVSQEIQQAMSMRLEYPDCSVAELAEKIFITRPGLMYRFRVIRQLAEKIRVS